MSVEPARPGRSAIRRLFEVVMQATIGKPRPGATQTRLASLSEILQRPFEPNARLMRAAPGVAASDNWQWMDTGRQPREGRRALWSSVPMIRGTVACLLLHCAIAAVADGVSDGSLARSSAQPFKVARNAGGESLMRVERLVPDSAAHRAGLRNGDVIERVDGMTYDSPTQGRRLLERGRDGRATELVLSRDGMRHSIRYLAPDVPFEDIPGVTSLYGSLATADGLRLRTITTRPRDAVGRLPAIYFLQWLSCDSIEYPLNPEDHGWQSMLQLLASRSGAMMMRTEKAGVGDSEGDCAELDYDTELGHHRAALRTLQANPLVDPARIVIFGASMGGNMAALLAAEFRPAGLVIWGTAIKSWFEHLVMFNRRHLELSGRAPDEIADAVSRQVTVLREFLVGGRSPAEIAAANTALGHVWGEIRGSSDDSLYGRPSRFHQQAQAQNWLGAIARVRAPVLVLYGEYDWYEELDDHMLIARQVERYRQGAAKLVVVPGMDHHFSIYPSLDSAFRREGGFVAPERPVMEIVAWLATVVSAGTSRDSSGGAAAPSSRAS